MYKKGIILAGGTGSRLRPLTNSVCKQLLPVYDKPMIYYPLSTLMMAGIRDILVISSPDALPLIEVLLGNGSHLGLKISYLEQPRPEGIAQALLIGEAFIAGEPFALILGDNIFYGNELISTLRRIADNSDRNTIFGCKVNNPENFGVVTLDRDGTPLTLEEKPAAPSSGWVVPGLYFYTPEAVSIAHDLRPSERGELEITDVNRALLETGNLEVELLGRGYAWLDCGTPETLLEASQFIRVIEQRAGLKICCPEEIALRSNFINKEQFTVMARNYSDNAYARYLLGLLDEL